VPDAAASQPRDPSTQCNSSMQSLSQECVKTDGQEWAVVDGPEDETDTHSGEMSSSFKFQLGWGTWRFTLFSWEINIKREHAHNNNDR
jgi:hypothetical protein